MNIIKTAEMENFRGYADKNNHIEFRHGINLVLGDNATGKSTIVTLILFNLLHKKIDVASFEDYRTIEPMDLQNFRSKLSIIGTDGKEYAIEKILPLEGRIKIRVYCGGEELRKYGELELARLKDAQKFITERFGARAEILEDILIQTQDPVKLLWPVREATEVGKELSKLLRLEPLQNIYTNARSVERMLEDKAKTWEKEATETEKQIEELGLLTPREYKKEKKKLEIRRDNFKIKATGLDSKIEKARQGKKVAQEEFNTLQKKSGELTKTEKQIQQIKGQIKGLKRPKKSVENLKQQKSSLEDIQSRLQKKLGDIRQRIGGLQNAEGEAKRQRKRLQPKLKSYSEEYDKVTRALASMGIPMLPRNTKEIEKLVKVALQKHDELGEKIGGLKERIRTEIEYKSILSEAKAKCPVCDTRLTSAQRRRIVAEKTKLIDSLKTSIKKEQKESKNAKKIIELLEKIKNTLKELAGITEKLSEAKSRLTNVKRKLPLLKRKRVQIEDRLKKLGTRILKIEDEIQIAVKFSNIDELKIELRELKRELKRLPKLEKQVKKLESEIDKLDRKRREVDGEIRELSPKIENLKEKVKEAEVWYNKLATAQNRTKTAYEFAEEVRFAHEAAKLSLHEIFTSYCDMINSNLAWIWPRLYTRPDLKKIELNVEIKETEENGEKTLTPEVQLNRLDARGDKLPFNTISSHGQRVLASIAFRVAFLNLLSRTSVPRILVLDEPTIWIDDKNRERLGHVLGTLVKEIKEGGIKIDQVIVISHDSIFLNAIDPEGVKHLCMKNSEGFCEVTTASA